MKKHFLAFLVVILVLNFIPYCAFAMETSIKGFIALDALNYEKIEQKAGTAVIGIGVLDLKIFAEQEQMAAAVKLNIDGNLSVQNNIFEEAYVSYRGIKNWKLSLGKGVIKFQNLHWGAIENTYLDGGSVLGTENGWRKVSNKAFISAAYGNHSQGFLDTFSIWGDSVEVNFDDKGKNPIYITTGKAPNLTITGYSTKSVPAFTTSKQIGFANKVELYSFDNWTFTTGQIVYNNKLAPKTSYAIDFGASKESKTIEYWADLMYGVLSKTPYEPYTTFTKNEYFLQLGTQYHFDEFWSVVGNTEWTYVKDLAHTYPPFTIDGTTYTTDAKYDKNGQTVESISYKIESAIQYQLSKSSFITTGALYERKLASKNGIKNLASITGVDNPNSEAFKVASSVSFWF